jgi:hypothetical protein
MNNDSPKLKLDSLLHQVHNMSAAHMACSFLLEL